MLKYKILSPYKWDGARFRMVIPVGCAGLGLNDMKAHLYWGVCIFCDKQNFVYKLCLLFLLRLPSTEHLICRLISTILVSFFCFFYRNFCSCFF